MINQGGADRREAGLPPRVRQAPLPAARGRLLWQNSAVTKTTKARKQPYFISPEDSPIMALAGLYEFWRDHAVEEARGVAVWGQG